MKNRESLKLSRRQCLSTFAGAAAGLAVFPRALFAKDEPLPPVRAITKKPKHHWFGYYDKLQFDPTNRFVLGMEVDFEHRSPEPDDSVGIGMVDLQDKDRWISLGRSHAWGWQQGCMLQWVPGTESTVMWNDRDKNRFICRLVDTQTNESRIIDSPVYTLSPDGKTGISPDFSRLNDVRPGYGYAGVPDRFAGELAPEDTGIWKVDMTTGKRELVISLAQIAKFEPRADMVGAKHWFNHLLFNTDGTRFEFLHRWRPKGVINGFRTRMLTANLDGKDLCIVDGSGSTSHFIWRDPQHLLAWTKPTGKQPGFYLFRDQSDSVEQIGEGIMTENGHCTYLPGNEWILNDTYPDKARLQHPYLYNVKSNRRVPLGHFLSPKQYADEWRCDNHPRFSRDGKSVVIDSPHGGNGRQMYLIDVSKIVA
jgi:hypothetical protein